MKKTLTFFLSLVFSSLLLSQPVADGVISPGEYGTHTNGANQITTNVGLTTVYMTWDANNLYVGLSGGFTNQDGLNLYLDLDAGIPVNGAGIGTNNGTGFDSQTPVLPFLADIFIFAKDGYNAVRFFDGTNWNDGSDPLLCFIEPIFCGGLDNKLPQTTMGTVMEFSVPFGIVTGLGLPAPSTFNFLGFLSFDNPGGCGTFAHVPEPNLIHSAGACPATPSLYHYFTVTNLYTAPVTFPFSQNSFTQHNTGDFLMAATEGTVFHDVTIHDGSFDNLDNATFDLSLPNRLRVFDSFEIQHDLFIGPGSALYPDDARGPTIAFSGNDGHLYNRGRLESNPDDMDVFGEKLSFTFSGNTTVMPTTILKDLYRFSDINIPLGGTLQASAAGTAEVEFQWGTLTNEGTLDFYNSLTGYVDAGIRGDITALPITQNDYFFATVANQGSFEFHDLLIGRFSSHLMPAVTGTVMDVHIKGDFENYDEFSGQNGAARIDIIMSGEKAQFIRGNVDETTGATTTFGELEIANTMGDVMFESFQNTSPAGSHVDYVISGVLTLTNGDLVTRNRVDNSVHNLTVSETGSITFAGATNGGAASCFVDGPLRREVNAAGITALDFPVGKTSGVNGDYRHVSLALSYALPTLATYTAEMFIQDRSNTYGFPAPVMGEDIGNISNVRYWNVSPDNTTNLTSATITLGYNDVDRDDGVEDAPNLRVLKDNGTDWENISPGLGGTANDVGTITSLPFTTFSDFTLANLIAGNNPLDVSLVSFGGRWEDLHIRLDWITSREKNLDYFGIERSKDGITFLPIDNLLSLGNSEETQSYSFRDTELSSRLSLVYYRLKMVDLDGTYTYSQVIAVAPAVSSPVLQVLSSSGPGELAFWVKGEINPGVWVSIKDISGRMLMERSVEENASNEFRIGPFAAGIYFVTLHNQGSIETRKVVVW